MPVDVMCVEESQAAVILANLNTIYIRCGALARNMRVYPKIDAIGPTGKYNASVSYRFQSQRRTLEVKI